MIEFIKNHPYEIIGCVVIVTSIGIGFYIGYVGFGVALKPVIGASITADIKPSMIALSDNIREMQQVVVRIETEKTMTTMQMIMEIDNLSLILVKCQKIAEILIKII
jgi:hypothetical protein